MNRPAFSFAFLDLGNYQGKQFSGDFEVDGADIEKPRWGVSACRKRPPSGGLFHVKEDKR